MDKLRDRSDTETKSFSKKIIKDYINDVYKIEEVSINDYKNQNYGYDIIINSKSFSATIEEKTRYFYSNEKYGKYIYENDILIELYQSMNLFKDKSKYEINNQNINRLFSSYDINIAIGWFYKCNADRLVYIKLLDDKLYTLYDINFKFFKSWVLTKIDDFNLQYSKKTTGTINLIIPVNLIPKVLITEYKHESKPKKIREPVKRTIK